MAVAPAQFEDITLLENKLAGAALPPELAQKTQAMLARLVRLATQQGYSQEYDSVARYLDWIISLPWNKRSTDTASLENAKKILDANHHGLDNVKERILEYIAVANLKNQKHQNPQGPKAPTLLFLGLVGTGKTTMAYSIAQALGRQFGRIPMGGMGDAIQLRGRAKTYTDAEPGQIMKVLRRVQTKNPVILLDEIDRVTDEAKADIMSVLVELLDPEQNSQFLEDDVWPQIVRPLGFDAGMRTLERTLNNICRKVAKLKVESKLESLTLTAQNLKDYLPKW